MVCRPSLLCILALIVRWHFIQGYTVQGNIEDNTNRFLFLTSFCGNATGVVLQYDFVYPKKYCCPRILSYYHKQWRTIWPEPDQTCEEKQKILETDGSHAILDLNAHATRSGCEEVKSAANSTTLVCQGMQSYVVESTSSSSPKCWYLAVSNCNSSEGLRLNYTLSITGAWPNSGSNSNQRLVNLACLVSLAWLSIRTVGSG